MRLRDLKRLNWRKSLAQPGIMESGYSINVIFEIDSQIVTLGLNHSKSYLSKFGMIFGYCINMLFFFFPNFNLNCVRRSNEYCGSLS
jgi:hypothetical protein